MKEATGKTIRAVKRCFLIRFIPNIEIGEDQILVGLVKDLCVTRRNRRRPKVQRLAIVEFWPQLSQSDDIAGERSQTICLAPSPSLISPVPLPFSKSLIVALPCSHNGAFSEES